MRSSRSFKGWGPPKKGFSAWADNWPNNWQRNHPPKCPISLDEAFLYASPGSAPRRWTALPQILYHCNECSSPTTTASATVRSIFLGKDNPSLLGSKYRMLTLSVSMIWLTKLSYRGIWRQNLTICYWRSWDPVFRGSWVPRGRASLPSLIFQWFRCS